MHPPRLTWQRRSGGSPPRAGMLARALGRLPLRIRLIAGFAATMLVVLAGAGGFVYLRVRYALDLRLNQELAAQSTQLTDLARTGNLSEHTSLDTPVAPGASYQVLDAANRVTAGGPGASSRSLLSQHELDSALHRPLRADRGPLLPIRPRPLRLYAVPLHPATPPAAGQPAVAVVAVRRDQRDEALRELIGQLVLANLAALAIACLVGYRLTHAALAPVERYRTEAARIAAGATGVRLMVPDTAHDEVARLGRTLNDMLGALETALNRERRFVNDASHELRTPLTLLATELELALRRPRTPAELEQTLRSVAADTANLITLAGALLDIGVQPAPIHAAPVDLGNLLTAIIDRYRHTCDDTCFVVQADLGTPLTVQGDPTRLGQIVTNLLDNAVRHGAAPITVTTARSGDQIRLTVHDAGPGMTAQFLPHAAERFRRADTARTTPGTGLGLSIVEAIVHAHHGELRVCAGRSHHQVNHRFAHRCEHPETGTTITVLLPAAATGLSHQPH